MTFDIEVRDGQLIIGEEAEKLIEEARRLNLRMKKNEILMDQFREALKNAMAENGIKKFANDRMTATYTPEHTAERFDSKAFKAEHPRQYAKYVKETFVKDSVRVSFAE